MEQTILTNFIKLTNPDKVVDKAIWINPQQITCLQTETSPGKKPKTIITLTTKLSYLVGETPEQIRKKIADMHGLLHRPL